MKNIFVVYFLLLANPASAYEVGCGWFAHNVKYTVEMPRSIEAGKTYVAKMAVSASADDFAMRMGKAFLRITIGKQYGDGRAFLRLVYPILQDGVFRNTWEQEFRVPTGMFGHYGVDYVVENDSTCSYGIDPQNNPQEINVDNRDGDIHLHSARIQRAVLGNQPYHLFEVSRILLETDGGIPLCTKKRAKNGECSLERPYIILEKRENAMNSEKKFGILNEIEPGKYEFLFNSPYIGVWKISDLAIYDILGNYSVGSPISEDVLVVR